MPATLHPCLMRSSLCPSKCKKELLRRCCERMLAPGSDVQACCTEAVEEVRQTCASAGLLAADCGVIAVRVSRAGEGRVLHFACVTSSESMGVGHASAPASGGLQLQSFVLRRPKQGRAVCTVYGRSAMCEVPAAVLDVVTGSL